MTQWESHPWQNDSALQWLDHFVEQTQLVEHIDAGLNLPLEQVDELRAAVQLLLVLSEPEVSLVPNSAHYLTLAGDRLLEVINAGLIQNRQRLLQVLSEIAALKSAAARQCQPGRHSDTSDHILDIAAMATEHFGLTLYDVIDIQGDIPESRTKDVVGTGFMNSDGALELQLDDGRANGFRLKLRCVPDDSQDFDREKHHKH